MCRTLYTLGYPELSQPDAEFIEAFRREHDLPYRDVVAAHFTLLFGCGDVALSDYTSHVEQVAAGFPPVSFNCRYAMLGSGADADRDTAYVFLVPDEGYAALSLLHDALYRGLMEPFLRLDVPFIPHITIGTLRDRAEAKSLCDELNERGLSIQGRVANLTVGELTPDRIVDLSEHRLGEMSGASA
ncbi:MAG: 2'-5' RNA ligase family protein [Gemmatimonadota bacterium]|nr:2'-5' RNA ligase family protein [Gemmatimonadota bacterium]